MLIYAKPAVGVTREAVGVKQWSCASCEVAEMPANTAWETQS